MWSSVFGALGVGANVAIYQQKNRKRILIFKLLSDVLWGLHYFLLSAYSGCAIAVIGIAREGVFINKDKKWAKNRIWLVLFLLISAVSAFLTWKNIFSILPACASIISVISFWQNKVLFTKIAAYPISICMLIYDIVSGSYFGIFNEIFTLVSTTAALVHLVRIRCKNSDN